MKLFQKILVVSTFLFISSVNLSFANDPQPIDKNANSDSVFTEQSVTISSRINNVFTPLVEILNEVLFYDPFAALGIYDPIIYDKEGNIVRDEDGEIVTAPLKLIVFWLIIGGIFFTIFLRFINIRGFRHSIQLIRGKYDNPNSPGEVTHFKALTTALSATVGLGNIAGVAIAMTIGGPGATFWMIIAGLVGISTKFTECTLGLKYRKIDSKGHVSGGPMYYLKYGLKKKKLGLLGSFLALLFAFLVMGGAIGGGCMFQANQAFEQFTVFVPFIKDHGVWYGLGLAFLVGLVIIGGIKSIANVTSKIVPFMGLLYIVAALIIIGINIDQTGIAFRMIIDGAFSPGALKGGFIGILIYGFQRGSFSNEAGIGSASIAHSVAKTNEPISEGIVALLEPFIDTVVICTMTALVIIFAGLYNNPGELTGVSLTSAAFKTVLPWFPVLLLIAVSLFAFSTMISWSYYGQKGFDYIFGGWSEKLFGTRKVTNTIFRLFFLGCVIVGSSSSLDNVINFSDMMILCMAFPNILGLYILAPEVRKDLKNYMKRLKSGEIKKYS